jgi:hypothetical protein
VIRDEDLEIILRRARAVTLQLYVETPVEVADILGGSIIIPGSDCPIPLADVGAEQTIGPQGSVRVTVPRLPFVDGTRLQTPKGHIVCHCRVMAASAFGSAGRPAKDSGNRFYRQWMCAGAESSNPSAAAILSLFPRSSHTAAARRFKHAAEATRLDEPPIVAP